MVKIRSPRAANYHPPIDVVFICTGNICRSPMAEAMLRARLADRHPEVRVSSAGLLFEDRPADPQVVKLMAKRGIDVRSHRARFLSDEILSPATLILGMERLHVRRVHEFWPDLFPRSYTLPEFVASAQVMSPPRPDTDVLAWVEQVGAARTVEAYEVEDRSLEIRDPHGGPSRVYREAADRIERDIDELVRLLWPVPRPAAPRPAPLNTGGIHADRDRI